jgi:hypothetical protein
MTASHRRRPRFTRRSRPEERTRILEIYLTDDEKAFVDAEAAALGMSFEDYVVMRMTTDAERVEGNA